MVLLGPGPVLLLDAASYGLAFLLDRHPGAGGAGQRGGRPRTRPSGPACATCGATGGCDGWCSGSACIEIAFTAITATAPILALQLTGGLHNGVSTGGNGGASVAGWLLGAYGAGSVVGGLISTRARGTGGAHVRARHRRAWPPSTWVLLLPVPVWGRALAIAGYGVAAGLFFPRFFAALTTQTPPALRARVLTAVTVALSAPGPIGFLGAGALAQWTGSATASLLLVAVAASVGAAIVVSAYAGRGARACRAPRN